MKNNIEFAPVAVFAYNRLDKIKNCIEHIEKCELANDTELFIFADGSKNDKDNDSVTEVQNWIKQYYESCNLSKQDGEKPFKSVNIQLKEKNSGLAKSIIGGVTDVIAKYGRVIVIEDDIIVSPSFLKYMNDGLFFYEKNKDIWAMASYGYNLKALKKYQKDVYIGYRASSWGWATWRNRWETVDWEVKDFAALEKSKEMQKKFCRGGGDLYPMLQRQMRGESDSWAIRWNYAASRQNRFTVYPRIGLVSNEGFDGSGSHTGNRGSEAKYYEHFNSDWGANVNFENVKLDPSITKEFYILHTDTLWKKVKRNLSPKNFRQMLQRKIKT